jgi:hypothetical protein
MIVDTWTILAVFTYGYIACCMAIVFAMTRRAAKSNMFLIAMYGMFWPISLVLLFLTVGVLLALKDGKEDGAA